ncbi:hypothetical protein O181_132928 [Austropuccinia psidii MF-1]|uniref:Uncharacterized protein n=1 Tax=Austropuccinia psidii MF-1 TaxID=1389203 RepID=A0A9Q3L4R1_9BASI|nr:hypothetical protein [Austropuccinia psidii MF-1]
MVNTRNGRNYSVQPDGSGKGRGKNRARTGRPSSRKAHFVDARVPPHSPMSVPTKFEINSETELIKGNVSRFEPLPSGRIEIYQSQYKNWCKEAKEEEWEICSGLLKGAMNVYLHMKRFLGWEKTIELLAEWIPFSCKDKFKNINHWLKNQILLSIDQKKELEMTPDFKKQGPVVSNSSKPAPEQSKYKPKGPQKRQRSLKKNQGKGNWHRPYPQG